MLSLGMIYVMHAWVFNAQFLVAVHVPVCGVCYVSRICGLLLPMLVLWSCQKNSRTWYFAGALFAFVLACVLAVKTIEPAHRVFDELCGS
jgi:Flp pilus assembly protein TadB